MLSRPLRPVVAAVALLLACASGEAHGQTREYALKAEFLERFTQFVDWPAETFPAPDDPFVLCVVGENPFGGLLEEMARARRFEHRRGEVRYFADLDDLDALAALPACHLAWLSHAGKRTLAAVVRQTDGKPILTVGDTPGYAEAGFLVNFFLEGGRIRFEINHPAVERSGLAFSSQLLRLARVIH
ncbi:MAG: YfiR family protein [Pseudomonadota bacterium]|nr:YfiR family protein [Pseudomonadota bacterium]